MTKFKVGSIILNRLGSKPGEEVDCEGIIVRHWRTPSRFDSGMVDNVDIYITLDKSWPSQANKVVTHLGFKESQWELKQ